MHVDAEFKQDDKRVHLFYCLPGQVTDTALLDRYRSLLTDEEAQRMSRFYFAGHRHQFLLTRALVRYCLSLFHPVEPGEWRFSTNRYGKPLVSHPEAGAGVSFNLSHASGMIVCAVAHGVDIGVDVEDTERTTQAAFDSLASYFSEREINDLAALPQDLQKQRFFDYWTLKESYIKARGMGLALPLGQFSFHFDGGKLDEFRVRAELGDDARNWRFWRISPDDRHQIAIALNTPQGGFEVKGFKTVPLISNEPVQLNFL
jgi:4'-phosphopantetheinyl transferase